MNTDYYFLLAFPFFLGSIIFEFLYGRSKDKSWYNFEDAITNFNLGIASQAFNTMLKLLLLAGYSYIYDNYAFFHIGSNVWTFILCVVVFDFIYYWAHRWSHEWNIFWGAHIVHHHSQEFNLSVAIRQSWIQNALSFALFLPIPFMGFEPLTFAGAAVFVTLYQYWIHTRIIGGMGWFEYIFNSPSHHRVHHGINAKYLDKNYGAVFIIWDRMFGTFQKEEEEAEYGTTVPLNSWNPVWANVHFYAEMWQGMKKLEKWKDRFDLIFRRPAFLGNLLGQKNNEGKAEKIFPEKYRTKVPLNMQLYVLFQFVVLAYGVAAYTMHFNELSIFYKTVFFLLIILTTLNCGAIMENKNWFTWVEAARVLAFLPVYNTLYYYYYPAWLAWILPGSILLVTACMLWLLTNWFYYAHIKPSCPPNTWRKNDAQL